jgi:pimeloyl-ACP methyl ester carboxylesterase
MLVSRELDLEIGPMTQGHAVTDDGVQLLYQIFGDGPSIVFANGIGVRYPGVVRQMAPLRQAGYRVVCWDYRGMGQSIMPDPRRGDVSMPRHARDILAILDHLAIERAIFIGWSMGVQVSLEAIRAQPDRVAGFVALLGTYGRPFQTAFPGPVARGIEELFTFLNRNPMVAQAALNLAVAAPRLAFAVLSRGLFVGAHADRAVFDANVRSVAGVEKTLYTRTLLELSRHDAGDVLAGVTCPALIIAGERDHLTPPDVAMHMARSIRGAVYREVKGGTHFAMIEQPDLINGWLLELAREVYGAAADRGAAAAGEV